MNRLFPMRLFFVPAFACLFVLAPMAATSPAFANTSHPASVTHKNCQIVLDKLQPGETTSKVLSSQCTTANQPLVAPAASALLMTWYVNISYGGDSTTIYGKAGPCDSAGYGIGYVGDAWNDTISSFKVWNNCNYTSAFANKNYGGACQKYNANVPFVGSALNDEISSFWVSSNTFHGC
jgi:hypothetical protein